MTAAVAQVSRTQVGTAKGDCGKTYTQTTASGIPCMRGGVEGTRENGEAFAVIVLSGLLSQLIHQPMLATVSALPLEADALCFFGEAFVVTTDMLQFWKRHSS